MNALQLVESLRDGLMSSPQPSSTDRTMGVDLSLTSTGLVCLHHDGDAVNVYEERIRPKSRGPQRLVEIRNRILWFVSETGIRNIAIEGYSFGSKGAAVFQLGELGGLVRVALLEAGCTLWIVAPSTNKKLATGSGNASKDIVLREVHKRWGFNAKGNDTADAFVLAVSLLSFLRRDWTHPDDEKTWSKAKRLDPIVRRRRR